MDEKAGSTMTMSLGPGGDNDTGSEKLLWRIQTSKP